MFSKTKRIRNPGLLKEMKEKIGRCLCCGSTENIQAHHIRCRKTGGHDLPFNILVVCFKCHRLIHDKGTSIYKTWPHVISYLTELGWSYVGNRFVNEKDYVK